MFDYCFLLLSGNNMIRVVFKPLNLIPGIFFYFSPLAPMPHSGGSHSHSFYKGRGIFKPKLVCDIPEKNIKKGVNKT